MLDELASGIILFIVIFLFIIVIGSELFTIMVNEQLRYLRLITHYAPVPAPGSNHPVPEPVARYLSWAEGRKQDPAMCVRISHAGRFRYGRNGRWMKMGGEGFLSLAVPAYVWRTTILYAPILWLETFDHYVDRVAGMNLSLFSVFPLETGHTEEMKAGSLFRYLSCTLLFPSTLASSSLVKWENIDDSAAKAVIRDGDVSAEGIVRFDSRGAAESIEACHTVNPATGRPLPGHYLCRFSSWTETGGQRIPMQVESEIILPDGELVCAEYIITAVEFDAPVSLHGRGT
jgi:hypothetical protein